MAFLFKPATDNIILTSTDSLFVTTPSRNITFGSQNCPIMEASNIKSFRFLSAASALEKEDNKDNKNKLEVRKWN